MTPKPSAIEFPNPPDDDREAENSRKDFLTSVVLSRKAASGDQDAFSALYERHFENVLRSLAWRLKISYERCYQDYEDVVNQSFCEAFMAIRDNNYTAPERVGAFRNWVATICLNNALDSLRRKGATKRGGGKVRLLGDVIPESSTVDFGLITSRHASPTQILGKREQQVQLDDAIKSLRDKYRQVLDLRLNCQMSFLEIAAELGYEKDVTVRSIYHRAVEQLKDLMSGETTK